MIFCFSSDHATLWLMGKRLHFCYVVSPGIVSCYCYNKKCHTMPSGRSGASQCDHMWNVLTNTKSLIVDFTFDCYGRQQFCYPNVWDILFCLCNLFNYGSRKTRQERSLNRKKVVLVYTINVSHTHEKWRYEYKLSLTFQNSYFI